MQSIPEVAIRKFDREYEVQCTNRDCDFTEQASTREEADELQQEHIETHQEG